MKHKLTKNITCTDSSECANQIRKKLETPTLKLMARNPTDTVNGHITIHHENGKHLINITIYETDETPNNKHQTTFKTPNNKPSTSQLESKL